MTGKSPATRRSAAFARWLIVLRLSGSLIVGLWTSGACAQTVRPLVEELGNPAKGRIEYVNDSLTPLSVVLEAKSFTVSETGAISYRPLDPGIHLKLSASSFRLQPQQSYYVFYEASADTVPSWFVVYAAFSGFPFRTQEGMAVRLELPHTVYLLTKHGVEKSEVVVNRAEYSAPEKTLKLEVENTGNNFGRILQTTVTFGKKKEEAPGFPIFPHSKRSVEIPLEEAAAPSGFVLELQNFKIEETVPPQSP
jgi:hypothetical protein